MSIFSTIKNVLTFNIKDSVPAGTKINANTVPIGSSIASGAKGILKVASAIPKVAKAVTSIAVTGLVSVGLFSALKENPKLPVQGVKTVAGIGKDLGKFSTDPSLKGIVDFAKEHPVVSTTVPVVIGVYALGKVGAGNALASYFNSSGTRELAQSIRDS